MTILIADDDRVHIQLVTAHLKKAGFAVAAAFDALQAFTLALRTLPAAILLNVNMPTGRASKSSNAWRIHARPIKSQ